jgi:hypothetical protein
MSWRDRMKKQDIEPYTFNTFYPLYGADGENGTDKKYNAYKKYDDRKTQTLETIPAPEPPGMGPAYDRLWNEAWLLAEFVDGDTAPYADRKAKLPELMRMRDKLADLERAGAER